MSESYDSYQTLRFPKTRRLMVDGGRLGRQRHVVLQVIWFSGWAVLPLLVDIALLWAVLGRQASVDEMRG